MQAASWTWLPRTQFLSAYSPILYGRHLVAAVDYSWNFTSSVWVLRLQKSDFVWCGCVQYRVPGVQIWVTITAAIGYFWSRSFTKTSSSFVSVPHYHPGNPTWCTCKINFNITCMVFAINRHRFTNRTYKRALKCIMTDHTTYSLGWERDFLSRLPHY